MRLRSRTRSPARAEQVISYARPAMAEIMQLFAPDGGFEEGPVYWTYATIYNVLYIRLIGDCARHGFRRL